MAFDLDLTKRLGDADVALRLEADAGLIRPDQGHVRVDGKTLFDGVIDVPPERRRAGYVFQEPRLFPHMRVADNLRYAGAREAMVDVAAELLDIGDLLDRWPRTLSGGEAKRVAIGRALLSEPAFLLLDEPTASLDRARADEVERAIRDVRDELQLPILMVTHDRAEAERLATQVVEMYR